MEGIKVVPRSYALGVLLERLHGDVVLERLDAYCGTGQSPQEKSKIKTRRDRKVRRAKGKDYKKTKA